MTDQDSPIALFQEHPYRAPSVMPLHMSEVYSTRLEECPFCGYTKRPDYHFYGGGYIEPLSSRVKFCKPRSWFSRLLNIGCSLRMPHAHQDCYGCKAVWVILPDSVRVKTL